jgi:hypothetical protein
MRLPGALHRSPLSQEHGGARTAVQPASSPVELVAKALGPASSIGDALSRAIVTLRRCGLPYNVLSLSCGRPPKVADRQLQGRVIRPVTRSTCTRGGYAAARRATSGTTGCRKGRGLAHHAPGM